MLEYLRQLLSLNLRNEALCKTNLPLREEPRDLHRSTRWRYSWRGEKYGNSWVEFRGWKRFQRALDEFDPRCIRYKRRGTFVRRGRFLEAEPICIYAH